jgi:putative transposase
LNVKSTKGIILHSDLGTQYTSQKFQELVSKKEMIHSGVSI